VCREERYIEDTVERELERRERMARKKLESAEMGLEYTQRVIQEVFVAIEEANGGDPGFRLPRRPAEAYTNDPVSDGPAIRSAPAPFEESFGTYASSSASYLHVAPIVPSANHFSDSTLPVTLVSPSINHASLKPSSVIVSSNVGVTPSIRPAFTKLQVSTFEKYERMMSIALEVGPNLSIPQVPWPIFTPALSSYPTTDLTKKGFKPDAITRFFRTYIRWKGWDLSVGRDALLQDWTFLLCQIPQSKRGGHKAASKTVVALRTLLV